MQLQGLPAGNRTRILWITRPVLYHWATEAVADNLGKFSIYVNEMVMPVKYKFPKIRLIDHESRLYLPNPCFQCNFDRLCFDSIYSWKKEIKELSLSYNCFYLPRTCLIKVESKALVNTLYKRLSPCAYQIDRVLGKVNYLRFNTHGLHVLQTKFYVCVVPQLKHCSYDIDCCLFSGFKLHHW